MIFQFKSLYKYFGVGKNPVFNQMFRLKLK
jgi:hypothetical protein